MNIVVKADWTLEVGNEKGVRVEESRVWLDSSWVRGGV